MSDPQPRAAQERDGPPGPRLDAGRVRGSPPPGPRPFGQRGPAAGDADRAWREPVTSSTRRWRSWRGAPPPCATRLPPAGFRAGARRPADGHGADRHLRDRVDRDGRRGREGRRGSAPRAAHRHRGRCRPTAAAGRHRRPPARAGHRVGGAGGAVGLQELEGSSTGPPPGVRRLQSLRDELTVLLPDLIDTAVRQAVARRLPAAPPPLPLRSRLACRRARGPGGSAGICCPHRAASRRTRGWRQCTRPSGACISGGRGRRRTAAAAPQPSRLPSVSPPARPRPVGADGRRRSPLPAAPVTSACAHSHFDRPAELASPDARSPERRLWPRRHPLLRLPGMVVGPSMAAGSPTPWAGPASAAAATVVPPRRHRASTATTPSPGTSPAGSSASPAARDGGRRPRPGRTGLAAVVAGERDGTEVAVDLADTQGLVLHGPGGDGVARAAVIGVLAIREPASAVAMVVGDLLPAAPRSPAWCRRPSPRWCSRS